VIMRTSGGLIEAEPSRLGSSGTAFSVTWDRP
jgi:hypothetical protein